VVVLQVDINYNLIINILSNNIVDIKYNNL